MPNLIDIPATLQIDASLLSPGNGDSQGRASKILSPQDFLQVGDDDSAMLERFFAFAASPEADLYDLSCRGIFHLDRPLLIADVGRDMHFQATFYDTVGMDDVITIRNCAGATWDGKITVRGVRDNTSWMALGADTVNCVRIEDSRTASLCDFFTKGHSGWGVYHGSDNSNMIQIGNVGTYNGGASNLSGRDHSMTVASFSNNNNNSVHQRTHLHIDAASVIPSAAHHLHRGFVLVNGKPHKITSVDYDARIVTVYPRIGDPLQVPGLVVNMLFGGSLCLNVDGWAAKAEHGMVTATRCGIGLWSSDMYSSFGAGVTGQYNGVDLVLGSDPDNAYGGTQLGSLYTEKEQVATIIHAGQIEGNSSTITSVSALTWEKLISLGWNSKDGSQGSNGVHFPVNMAFDGEWITPSKDDGIVWGTGSDKGYHGVQSAPASNAATHAYIVRGKGGLKLEDNVVRRELRGIRPTQFHLYGDGDNGQYDGEFAIICEEGYTVNGQPFDQPVILPPMTSPVTIYALLAKDYNWIVSVTRHEVI